MYEVGWETTHPTDVQSFEFSVSEFRSPGEWITLATPSYTSGSPWGAKINLAGQHEYSVELLERGVRDVLEITLNQQPTCACSPVSATAEPFGASTQTCDVHNLSWTPAWHLGCVAQQGSFK